MSSASTIPDELSEPSHVEGPAVAVPLASVPRTYPIGLALSGGGFRATIFHLGVIQYLFDKNLLEQVAIITSVSGGSITGAHLVARWQDYTNNPETFRTAKTSLADFVGLGVRNRIAALLPFLWLAQFFRWFRNYNATDMLSGYYLRHLFSDGPTLGDLEIQRSPPRGAPALMMMVTDLAQHDASCYFDSNGLNAVSLAPAVGPSRVPLATFSLARAVAASSAYPALFPAMEMSERKLPGTLASALPFARYLTDGGVFDNVGVNALRSVASTHGCKSLIISNAGAVIDWSIGKGVGSSYLKTLRRCADIWQYNVERLGLAATSSVTEYPVDIKGVGTPPVGLTLAHYSDIALKCARVRTDLDHFSRDEFDALFDHGYCVARKILAPLVAAAGTTPRTLSHRPFGAPTFDPLRTSQVLERSSVRKMVGVSHLGPIWLAYLGTLLAAVLAVFIGWRFAAPSIAKATSKFTVQWWELHRAEWKGPIKEFSTKLNISKGFSNKRELTLHELKNQVDIGDFVMTEAARKHLESVALSMKVKLAPAEELLMYARKTTFGADYRTICRRLRLGDNAPKLLNGRGFLVSEQEAERVTEDPVGYREFTLCRDPQTGECDGYVLITTPNANEYIILFLVVESGTSLDLTQIDPVLENPK